MPFDKGIGKHNFQTKLNWQSKLVKPLLSKNSAAGRKSLKHVLYNIQNNSKADDDKSQTSLNLTVNDTRASHSISGAKKPPINPKAKSLKNNNLIDPVIEPLTRLEMSEIIKQSAR